MGKHSLTVGGSSALPFLKCHKRRQLLAELPDAIDIPSIYASEGSALHDVIAAMVEGIDGMPSPGQVITVEQDGRDIEITQELIHDCLEPAWAAFQAQLAELGPGVEIYIEETVAFPGLEGSFGTADIILFSRAKQRTVLWDWKFGAGEAVFAVLEDEEGFETLNAQLMFYLAAARHSCPEMFAEGGTLEIVICQPRAPAIEGRLTRATVTHEEVDDFIADMHRADAISQTPEATLQKGDWCRWCLARPHCPEHLKPLLDLSAFEIQPVEVGDRLAHILDLAPAIEELIAEARRQAVALLESEGRVPGWKIVPKRTNRQWIVGTDDVVRAFRKLNVTKKELFEIKLKSPAQAEKLVPGYTLPTNLADKPLSTTSTLAPESDHRADLIATTTALKRLAGLVDVD